MPALLMAVFLCILVLSWLFYSAGWNACTTYRRPFVYFGYFVVNLFAIEFPYILFNFVDMSYKNSKIKLDYG